MVAGEKLGPVLQFACLGSRRRAALLPPGACPCFLEAQLPAPSLPRLPSELFLVCTEAVVQNDIEGGFQWPSSQGGRDAVSLARVKPSTDPIKLRQAAFSISQHRRAAQPRGRNHSTKESPLPALRPASLLGAVQGWGVALHCHP